MRQIDFVVFHCSDSDLEEHDDIQVIDEWHKKRGWRGVGYHYFIKNEGLIQVGRKEEEIGAHVKGHNGNSLGICLSGKNNFSEEQYESAAKLFLDICKRHNLGLIDMLKHNQLDPNKTCPNFELKEVIKYLALEK